MTLGATIQMLRKQKKIKRKQLAASADLSITALYNIEKDLSFPTAKTLAKIAKSLGHSIGYVLVSTVTKEDLPEVKQPLYEIWWVPLIKHIFESEL